MRGQEGLTHHDTGVLGAAHDGGEHGARGVVTSKPSLAHTRPIVNHQCLNLLVTLWGEKWERGVERGVGRQVEVGKGVCTFAGAVKECKG